MNLLASIRYLLAREKALFRFIHHSFGFYPGNINLYKLAFCHKSASQNQVKGFLLNNERLEFLGDAVLGLVVGDYLFKRYPIKDEGFLTEIRSRIVNHSQLNRLAVKLGLDRYIQSEINGSATKYLFGNTFEALIGAIYLDIGFTKARKLIIERILDTHLDLEKVISEDANFKSKIIEWSQREKANLEYRLSGENENHGGKYFEVELLIDREVISRGQDSTIKGAEQLASARALEFLKNRYSGKL
ncbi:MAG: ribonuclease III [Bacteroidales bacterium]|nr:ribonuclease III [Bacteroidales bacterium]